MTITNKEPVVGNIIYYNTTNYGKLAETSSSSGGGLHTGAFNTTIKSHVYSAGGIITFRKSVTTIGDGAFSYASMLSSISIPETVTVIGTNAFLMCQSIKKLYIYDLTAWCNIDMASHPLGAGSRNEDHYLYLNNQEIRSLVIPNDVQSIKDRVFMLCTRLTSVVIPDNVTYIGAHSFNSCVGITSVTIGSGVTNIGNQAFFICSNLASVTCTATTPPTIGSYVFESTKSTLKIYVPADSVAAYKAAAGWSSYASKIYAIP